MGRRNKHSAGAAARGSSDLPAKHPSQAPVKQPTLLAVSIVLFGLWFMFLLLTALSGPRLP